MGHDCTRELDFLDFEQGIMRQLNMERHSVRQLDVPLDFTRLGDLGQYSTTGTEVY